MEYVGGHSCVVLLPRLAKYNGRPGLAVRRFDCVVEISTIVADSKPIQVVAQFWMDESPLCPKCFSINVISGQKARTC